MVKEHRREVASIEVIENIISQFKTVRDRGLVSVLYLSGRRIIEVLNLERKNLSYENDKLSIPFQLVKRKDKKIIITPIDLKDPIAKYIIEYVKWFDKRKRKGRLFPITSRRAHQIITNIDPNISPHWFRHCRATHLGEVMSVWELSSYFGWKRLDTALTYTHINPNTISKKMKEVRKESDKRKDTN